VVDVASTAYNTASTSTTSRVATTSPSGGTSRLGDDRHAGGPTSQDPITRRRQQRRAVRLVGFGVNHMEHHPDTLGREAPVSTTLQQFTSKFLGPRHSTHKHCEGDSRCGPAFMTRSGQDVIVGVTAFGESGCRRRRRQPRVDTYFSVVPSPRKS